MPKRTSLYVIYMPYTLKEYNIGHLLTTCKVSEREGSNGMRVSIIENKPEVSPEGRDCQYTSKVIDFSKKVPSFFRAISPSGSMTMNEVSYNSFPVCKTTYTSGALSDKKFKAVIDTCFYEGYKAPVDPFSDGIISERCEILDLVQEPQLAEGVNIGDMKDEKGEPLFSEGWQRRRSPVMTVFKRVQIDLHIPIIGKRYIGDIDKFMKKIFTQGHQEVIKYHEEWKNMTLDDIRAEEERVKRELDEKYPPKKK